MDPKALQKIIYGMFIVSAKKGDRMNGQIANTVFQISASPATIAVSVAKANLTHEFILENKAFSVSVLSQEAPMPFIGTFGFRSGKEIDKFKDVQWKTGTTGAPIVLTHAVACFEARLISTLDVFTHTVFIGEVVAAEVLNAGEAMSYSYYHQIKGGFTPKNAPTYVAREKAKKSEGAAMKKYRCKVCGYVYEPQKGDPDGKIPPGTPFEKLPDTWACPVCGAPKTEFEPIE